MAMRYSIVGAFAALLFSGVVSAQISVTAGGNEVHIGSGNDASNDAGGIAADVEIEGVTIINDKVYIDGVRVPKGTHEVTSKKTGKTYRIVWGKDGNITVTEK
jgi:hypothetical protein